jgi:3-oxoacyl-[acyl-carrier-protein] synthase II
MGELFSAVITGIGCVSPIGCESAAALDALLRARSGIRPVDLFPTSSFRARTAGQVPDDFNARAARLAPDSSLWPRASKFILLALAEALRERPGFQPDVVVAGTTSGGMDFGERFFRSRRGNRPSQARALSRGYVPHQPALEALGHFGISSPVRVVSNACASGTNAVGCAAGLVRNGHARSALAIGFDALSEFVFAGFDSLQASTDRICRPFDLNRDGLALGEGAAAILIERGEDAPGHLILAALSGYGVANDNFHLTKPDPSGRGPRLSMQRALADAGWESQSVDYINAHGTGTPFNDASEAAAIVAVCPEAPVSSTKGLTGHALGAAGAIEAVFCVLAIRTGFLPVNANVVNPIAGIRLVTPNNNAPAPQRILSNSFGFGGSNATIALEKCTA